MLIENDTNVGGESSCFQPYSINIKLFPIEGVLVPQVHVLCCLKSNCHKTAITTRSLNIENSNKNTASAIYLLYFNYLMHKNDIKLHTSCHKE